MPPSVVLATRNPGKVKEMREVFGSLGIEVTCLKDWPDVPEPDETGDTFAENARDKAIYYSQQTGHWCLADDSGLVVDALDGAPGVHSARYAADACPTDADREIQDVANNKKLLAELVDVPTAERTARFVCHLALADGETILLEAAGHIEGRIEHAPHGTGGFGYDPLFYVMDMECTTAELTSEQKNQISHRGKAIRRLADELNDLLLAEME